MTPSDAESILSAMLAEAGFNFSASDPAVGWSVFKNFVIKEVQAPGDGVLWQIGSYNFTGKQLCHFDFVRQFEIHDEGEFDHYEQLHLEFTAVPTPELANIERNDWSFDFPSLPAYFDHVEQRDEFKKALAHRAWQARVHQHSV